MNVRQVAVQVGIRDEQVIGKAQELVRLSSVKIPGGLGPVRRSTREGPTARRLRGDGFQRGRTHTRASHAQGEVCKAAACLELACST